VNFGQDAASAIVVYQGRSLVHEHLDATLHGLGLIVIPLVERAAVYIADARLFRRIIAHVIGVLTGAA
jgi:hypothetical protein